MKFPDPISHESIIQAFKDIFPGSSIRIWETLVGKNYKLSVWKFDIMIRMIEDLQTQEKNCDIRFSQSDFTLNEKSTSIMSTVRIFLEDCKAYLMGISIAINLQFQENETWNMQEMGSEDL